MPTIVCATAAALRPAGCGVYIGVGFAADCVVVATYVGTGADVELWRSQQRRSKRSNPRLKINEPRGLFSILLSLELRLRGGAILYFSYVAAFCTLLLEYVFHQRALHRGG